MMQTLVSFLSETASRRVKNIWGFVESQCRNGARQSLSNPYFVWICGQKFPLKSLSNTISELSDSIKPFTIHATGLGIFPGPQPTLYIPIVKTEQLYNLQHQIWSRFKELGYHPNQEYQPDAWVPGIPFTRGTLTRESLSKILKQLAFEEINLKITIDNLAFFDQSEGVKFSYPLKPVSQPTDPDTQ